MSGDRKEAARKYKETPKPMGVWAVDLLGQNGMFVRRRLRWR